MSAPIPIPESPKEASTVELRTAPRHRVIQRCFVRPELAAEGEPWRCIAYDISATGIGIVLPFHLRLGTGLQIEPSGLPGARALRARLVHSRPVDFVWFCGCEFFSRLSDTELKTWLQRPIDWASCDKSA